MSDISNTTGLTWNGSAFVGGAAAAPAASSAPGPMPAGTPSGATWNGTNWQWGGPTASMPSAGGKAAAASVPFNGMQLASSAGGTPVAQGFDLFYQMLQATLQAEQLRQSGIDQTVNIAQLASQLQRSSPTQAADFATQLGLPGLEPDLSFANRFAGARSTGTFGGKVGTQDIKLPFAFNGKEMSFFQNNPNVAKIISDIGARFGRPDVLGTSLSSLIPAGSNLFSL